MSEIFDFLKKTGSEQISRSAAPSNAYGVEPMREAGEINDSSVIAAPLSVDAEVCTSERFDLTDASQQVKNVLNPLTLFGEQFRTLRSRLALMQKQRGIKTVLITSSIPDEGKTFAASSMAGVFSQEAEKRVLLIDADMRKPKSGIHFGLNGSVGDVGLSEVLRGNLEFSKALLTSANPEFSFMPSGPLPPNPSELLSSPILEKLLKSASERFNWIFIDSPPALSLSDTILLSSLCDAVIFVIRAGTTPARLVKESIDRVGRDRICGVIMNRVKHIHTSRYYYQYYYRRSER